MGYRTHQNFIGSFDRAYNAVPDCINPRPEDVRSLMTGWERWSSATNHLDHVAAAAMTSFAFDYIHPIIDGNGRLHSHLLPHVMADMELLPQTSEYRRVVQEGLRTFRYLERPIQ